MNCELCGKPIDPNKPGTMRKVSGWEQVRGPGDGVRPIVMREIQGPCAHKLCVENARVGGKQEAML